MYGYLSQTTYARCTVPTWPELVHSTHRLAHKSSFWACSTTVGAKRDRTSAEREARASERKARAGSYHTRPENHANDFEKVQQHPFQFQRYSSTINAHKCSFFARTVPAWNALSPVSVCADSVAVFHSSVDDFYLFYCFFFCCIKNHEYSLRNKKTIL